MMRPGAMHSWPNNGYVQQKMGDCHDYKENPRCGYRLAAFNLGRNGADAAGRTGGSPSVQTRYRALLQPGSARPRADQGLHEGTSARAFRALQGGALPSLAEAVKSADLMGEIYVRVHSARGDEPEDTAATIQVCQVGAGGFVVSVVVIGPGARPASAQDVTTPSG